MIFHFERVFSDDRMPALVVFSW